MNSGDLIYKHKQKCFHIIDCISYSGAYKPKTLICFYDFRRVEWTAGRIIYKAAEKEYYFRPIGTRDNDMKLDKNKSYRIAI